jgi:hypothetical protein
MKALISNPTGSKTIDAKVYGSGLIKFKDGKDYYIDHISSPKWQGWTIKKKPFKWKEFFGLCKK